MEHKTSKETKEPALSKQVSFQYGAKSYTATFPKVRQIMEIESRKMLLTNNTYGAQERSGTEASQLNLNLVDMVAIFSVLCPDLVKDLGGDLYEMDVMETKPLLKVYENDFLPWYRKVKEAIYSELD